MPFSYFTRPLRGLRSPVAPRARLRAEHLEDRCTPTASLVSSNSFLGGPGNAGGTILSVSRNGQFAVVSSTSTDLVTGQVDVAGTPDLFWYDTQTGQRKLITARAGTNGTEALGTFTSAKISANGQFVAFVSKSATSALDSTFPASADAGSFTDDVFRWSAATGTTTLASRESNTKAFGLTVASSAPAISSDGSIVSFLSLRNANAVNNTLDDNGDTTNDLFAFNVGSASAVVVSFINPSLSTSSAFGKFSDVTVDPLGRYMDDAGRVFTFVSGISPDLIIAGPGGVYLPYPPNGKGRDAYMVSYPTVPSNAGATLVMVSTTAASVTRGIGVSNGKVENIIVAPENPQAVVFTAVAASGKTNELVTGYQNNNAGKAEVYLRVMTSGGGLPTVLISATNGTPNIGSNGALDTSIGAAAVSISTDGGVVAYANAGTNIDTTITDTNNTFDVFAWNLSTGLNQYVSRNSLNNAGGVASTKPFVNPDGRYVSFQSASTNLVGIIDSNNAQDVFVRDLQNSTLGVASAIPNGSQTGNFASYDAFVGGTGTGARVLFTSFANNLDPLFTFSGTTTNSFSAVLPVANSGASLVGVVSGGKSASTSFVSFNNQGQIIVGDKFSPFPGFTGEVRVAIADVTGDGVFDIVAGMGPGVGSTVVIIDGALGKIVRTFSAYEAGFTGGVYVAAADINADGVADIFLGAGDGGGPRVRVINGKTQAGIADFFIYEPTFRGGVRVATGDINGDGTADLITGAGIGGGPRVTITSGKTIGTTNTRLADFFAFENSLRNGVYIGTGDMNNDGKADLIVGAGPGGGPRVTVFDAANILTNNPNPTQLINFFAGDSSTRFGVRVALKDIDGDSVADILTGAGTGSAPRIRTYAGARFDAPNQPALIDDFFLYNDFASATGAWVG